MDDSDLSSPEPVATLEPENNPDWQRLYMNRNACASTLDKGAVCKRDGTAADGKRFKACSASYVPMILYVDKRNDMYFDKHESQRMSILSKNQGSEDTTGILSSLPLTKNSMVRCTRDDLIEIDRRHKRCGTKVSFATIDDDIRPTLEECAVIPSDKHLPADTVKTEVVDLTVFVGPGNTYLMPEKTAGIFANVMLKEPNFEDEEAYFQLQVRAIDNYNSHLKNRHREFKKIDKQRSNLFKN